MRKSPESTERPSYSPITVGSRSAFDTCMDDSPLESGGEQEQGGETDERRADAGDEQGGACAERGDCEAAERQGPELGAVAGAVVGGERAAAQRLGHALVDQRAQ